MQIGRKDEGYCVYYNTDHHWTSTGAFYAYEKAVEAFGDNAFDFESFDFETVYDDFHGTACRNGNYFFLNGEEIQVVKYDGYDKLKVELGRNLEYMEEKDGMYDLKALNGADPYNVFLHGKTRYLRITDTKDTEKETLLVVKDSFAHSLVPILARNYNIVMVDIDLLIDPKLGTKIDLANLVNKTGADKVLLVYNLQNVIENSNVSSDKALIRNINNALVINNTLYENPDDVFELKEVLNKNGIDNISNKSKNHIFYWSKEQNMCFIWGIKEQQIIFPEYSRNKSLDDFNDEVDISTNEIQNLKNKGLILEIPGTGIKAYSGEYKNDWILDDGGKRLTQDSLGKKNDM